MTDRYIKVVFTIIALSLIWLGVKDTPLEPVVSAQNQGWDVPFEDWDDDPLALGLPNQNLALPEAYGYAYVCYSRLQAGTTYVPYGDYGCTASGFLDSGLTVFASTPPRPARGGRVAPGPGFGSRTSPASTARCTAA